MTVYDLRTGGRWLRRTLRLRLTLLNGILLVGAAALLVLLSAAGSVVSSEELLERVWDENADPFTTTVRVTVMTLRKKLGDPGVIDTVVGAGYRVPAAG